MFLLICRKGLRFLGQFWHGQGFASQTCHCSVHYSLSLARHPHPVTCENLCAVQTITCHCLTWCDGVTAYLQTPTVPAGCPCRQSFCTECASKCASVHLPIWADLTNMAAGCPAGEPGWHTGGSLPPVGSGRGTRVVTGERAEAGTGSHHLAGSHNRCIIGPGTCLLLFCGETSVLTRANHLMPVNH